MIYLWLASKILFTVGFFFLGMAFGAYKMRNNIKELVEKEIDKQLKALITKNRNVN